MKPNSDCSVVLDKETIQLLRKRARTNKLDEASYLRQLVRREAGMTVMVDNLLGRTRPSMLDLYLKIRDYDPAKALDMRSITTKSLISGISASLTERSMKIMFERYINGLTLEQIARKNKITPERVRQIVFRSIQKLRAAAKKGWL